MRRSEFAKMVKFSALSAQIKFELIELHQQNRPLAEEWYLEAVSGLSSFVIEGSHFAEAEEASKASDPWVARMGAEQNSNEFTLQQAHEIDRSNQVYDGDVTNLGMDSEVSKLETKEELLERAENEGSVMIPVVEMRAAKMPLAVYAAAQAKKWEALDEEKSSKWSDLALNADGTVLEGSQVKLAVDVKNVNEENGEVTLSELAVINRFVPQKAMLLDGTMLAAKGLLGGHLWHSAKLAKTVVEQSAKTGEVRCVLFTPEGSEQSFLTPEMEIEPAKLTADICDPSTEWEAFETQLTSVKLVTFANGVRVARFVTTDQASVGGEMADECYFTQSLWGTTDEEVEKSVKSLVKKFNQSIAGDLSTEEATEMLLAGKSVGIVDHTVIIAPALPKEGKDGSMKTYILFVDFMVDEKRAIKAQNELLSARERAEQAADKLSGVGAVKFEKKEVKVNRKVVYLSI